MFPGHVDVDPMGRLGAFFRHEAAKCAHDAESASIRTAIGARKPKRTTSLSLLLPVFPCLTLCSLSKRCADYVFLSGMDRAMGSCG
jgi:hypothetical protein